MDNKDLELYNRRKQTVYEFICDDDYPPMKFKEMCTFLQVPGDERQTFLDILNDLTEEGLIIRSAKGRYQKVGEGTYKGTFIGNQRGFGFVRVEGMKEDFFVPEKNTMGAFHGDTVLIRAEDRPKGMKQEASVIKVLERGLKKVVGVYQKNKNFGFVIPDNLKIDGDIFISKANSMGAMAGHKVVAEIISYGDKVKSPEGKIIEILGHINDPESDVLSVVRALDIPVDFPDEVMDSLSQIPDFVSASEMAGRTDLRHLQTVTIDGEDAKDLDDAVSLFMDGENYVLGVHIADVSNYVQEHSALDVEALKRGTSVYLVDRVVPMLPKALSNGICSLNEKQDRLTLSCIMTINKKGEIIDHKIAETVICTNRRMTYTNVKKILVDKDPDVTAEYKELVPMFEKMEELAAILRKKRMKRGSIDFDFPETKVVLDEKGRPVDIKPYDRNVATKIIEDFMLAANETVAEDYFWQEIPFVYRTHDKPDGEKISRLSMFINNFGYTLHIGTDEVHPKELQKLLMKVEGTDEESLISRLTLRSMKQAKYTTVCTGHFGLAANYYCHFTSPIRRYPDLQIHRIIKDNLRGRMNEKRRMHYESILDEVAKQASQTERRAEEAERETVKLKKCEYMENHIGEEFEGVISGVTEWGFFVELPNTVEGLVRVTDLTDDFYEFYEDSYELVGSVTNRRYKLGQRVKVIVDNTDKVMRTIDFKLVQEQKTKNI